MTKIILLASAAVIGLLAACGAPTPTPVVTPTPVSFPTIVAPNGYRPLQKDDVVEGTRIDYQYVLPSSSAPVVVLAFSAQVMQLVSVKPQLTDGLIAYIQEMVKEPRSIYAFDENDPNQAEPKLMTLDAKKPVEIAFIKIAEGAHQWSATETDGAELRAAYKLIRRKDGGLRFVDAYDLGAVNSFNTIATFNGGGTGLVFSARLALLHLILADQAYQRGENVMATKPPKPEQYDARILKIDPTKEGLAQDLDWVLVSRPGPSGGRPLPQ